MTAETVVIDLPAQLYQAAAQIARVANRPLADIVRESLEHTLPPLDDLSAEEAAEMAALSLLDDASLWRVSASMLPTDQQTELQELLDVQNAGALTPADQRRMQELMTVYGRSLVRKAHAWLLLARRGYRVPVQPAIA